MAAIDSASAGAGKPPPVFVTTHWTVVLAAGGGDSSRAQVALTQLCRTYWYPLYAYVRRRGYTSHDAQDLTQEFFAQLLSRQSLAMVDPERGRFRSFLLASLNHFLASEWRRQRAQKRGGDGEQFSLDWAAAEERYDLEPATTASPDRLFEKQWALTLLANVLQRLEAEFHADGRGDLFASLKNTLLGTRETQPYAELASQLGMNESALKVAVHRLRKRYRELVREEIAQTLELGEDVDQEMRHLFQVLAE